MLMKFEFLYIYGEPQCEQLPRIFFHIREAALDDEDDEDAFNE